MQAKPLAAIGVLMAGVALSACTSTGETSAALEATTTVAYPPLPETIVTVPAAYAPGQPQGGSIAEASAVLTAAAVSSQAEAAQEERSLQPVIAATSADQGPTADAEAELASPAPAASGEAGQMVASAAPDAGVPEVVPASFAGPSPSAGALATPFDTGASAQKAMLIDAPDHRMGPAEVGARSAELDALMAKYAEHYEIPEELVRRVAKRESTFNPKARNGPYWGLMQIRHDTAKGMGYRGTASGLLDAETNLKYAVRYLRGAWLVAKGNLAVADKLYQRGYYYDAKRAGLLDETGLGKDRRRRNPS